MDGETPTTCTGDARPPGAGQARAAVGPKRTGVRRWRAPLVSLVLLLALLFASLPYFQGYLRRPPDHRFWAVPMVNAGDANQYLAFTRRAADGELLLGDPFTSEPHAPRLFLPQVFLQGLLCRVTGWSPLEAFQLSRVLAGAGLLAAGWWFGAQLIRAWRVRWLYLVLLCFSAGAGWLAERMGWSIPNGDLLQPEGNTFFTLGNLPHLALSQALLTGLFAALPAVERAAPGWRAWPWLILTLCLSALLSWTHPFDFAILALGLGTYAAIRWRMTGRFPRPSLAHAVAVVAGALPAALYLAWITWTDPLYRSLAHDPLPVQDFWFYAVAHGPLALPGLAVLLVPGLRGRALLPLCWVLPVFLALLLPLRLGGKQCRLVGGVHVPLAVLAAVGIDRVARAAAFRRRRSTPAGSDRDLLRARKVAASLGAGYCLLLAAGAWGMAARHAGFYEQNTLVFYHGPALQEMFRALDRASGPEEIALGGMYTGGWIPTWSRVRVYHGHWHMTLNESEKRAERNWFFTGRARPEARAAWLWERGITWVVWWPREWRGWGQSPEGVPGLQRVYASPDVALYRFSSAEPGATPGGGEPVPPAHAPAPH